MNTSHSNTDNQDATKSPERLEEEVNQTRARIGERLDTLSNRLSPGEVLDQVLGVAKEHGGEFTRNLSAQVKSNPLPLLITGIGMSWLMMASNTPKYQRPQRRYGAGYDHGSSPRYTDGFSEYPYNSQSTYGSDYERSMNNDDGSYYSGDQYESEGSYGSDGTYGSGGRFGSGERYAGDQGYDRDTNGEPGVMDQAKDAMGRVGEKVDDLKNAAREKMGRASESMHHRMDRASGAMHNNMGAARRNMRYMRQNARSAQECVTDFLFEQPVLAASLGVALGAAIGALLPATEVEDRLMGSARDEAMEKAQSAATDQYGKVREKAKDMAENVKQNMQGSENKADGSDGMSNQATASNTANQSFDARVGGDGNGLPTEQPS